MSGLSFEDWETFSQCGKIPSALQESTLPPVMRKRGALPAGGGRASVLVSAGLLHEVSFAADDP